MKELISTKGLAEWKEVPQQTIRMWVRQRKLPHYKLGRKLLRFDPDEVEIWLEELRRPAKGKEKK